MALASGIGATLEQIGDHATAFGEDQGRYVVTSRNPETIQAAGFPMTRIGTTGGASIRGAGRDVSLDELRRVHEGFFPGLMGADAALACLHAAASQASRQNRARNHAEIGKPPCRDSGGPHL